MIGEKIATKLPTNLSDDSVRLVAILVGIIVTSNSPIIVRCLVENSVKILLITNLINYLNKKR